MGPAGQARQQGSEALPHLILVKDSVPIVIEVIINWMAWKEEHPGFISVLSSLE